MSIINHLATMDIPDMPINHDLMLEIATQVPLPVDSSLFLALPDDVLKLIGHHVTPDSSIPMPSIQPTWVNTVPNEYSLKSLIAFRGTCRRVKAVVPLLGRIVKVRQLSQLQHEAWFQRDEVLWSTTRLHISLTDTFKTYNPDGVINTLTHLVRVLQRSPNIRQLSITRPIHDNKYHVTQSKYPLLYYQLPSEMNLPSLKHVAIRIECDKCANCLEPFFATLTAGTQSLKLYLPETTGVTPLSDCFNFSKVRFGTPMLALRVLYLRVGVNMDMAVLLDAMAKGCPDVREVHVSAYALDKMCLLKEIEVEMIDSGVEVCTWKQWVGGQRIEMPDLTEKLGSFKNLQVLDLGLCVKVAHHFTSDRSHIAAAPLTTAQLEQLESRQEEWSMRKMMNGLDLPLAQIAAARRLVQACPSIRQGWWWDVKGQNEGNVIERRGWTARIGDDGEPIVKLNDGALWLKGEFVNVYR